MGSFVLYSCTHWLRPRNRPLPPYLDLYTMALLVRQDRRHLFVAPRFKSRQIIGRDRLRSRLCCIIKKCYDEPFAYFLIQEETKYQIRSKLSHMCDKFLPIFLTVCVKKHIACEIFVVISYPANNLFKGSDQ